jgi:hypothetical protein
MYVALVVFHTLRGHAGLFASANLAQHRAELTDADYLVGNAVATTTAVSAYWLSFLAAVKARLIDLRKRLIVRLNHI